MKLPNISRLIALAEIYAYIGVSLYTYGFKTMLQLKAGITNNKTVADDKIPDRQS